MVISILSLLNDASYCGRARSEHLTNVEYFAAFYDVGKQNVHERMLAIERWTALIFAQNDPLDCS